MCVQNYQIFLPFNLTEPQLLFSLGAQSFEIFYLPFHKNIIILITASKPITV